jgi:hypothetical protein
MNYLVSFGDELAYLVSAQKINDLGNLRIVRCRKSYINTDAYTKGQTDGRQVGVHHGIETGGTKQRIIGK